MNVEFYYAARKQHAHFSAILWCDDGLFVWFWPWEQKLRTISHEIVCTVQLCSNANEQQMVLVQNAIVTRD